MSPAPHRIPEHGYSWPELRELLEPTLRTGLSALVLGHPGVGKSALAAVLADGLGLPLIDLRLAQQEPADLAGVYFPDEGRTRLDLLPPGWVRRVCDAPAFVFLDEVNAAVSRLHQAVAYQIVLEHRVGPFRFHPETVVLAAGNLEEDQALAVSMSSALCNRFVHFTLRPDASTWVDWARGVGLHPGIVAFVARHGERVLYRRAPGAQAFPSPRSWEMASRLLAVVPERRRKQAVAACVGLPAAEELFSFLRLYAQADPARILVRGRIPDFSRGRDAEPSRVHAIVHAVADWVRHEHELADDELPNVVRFLRAAGLDAEYRVLFLRRVRDRPGLLSRLKALPEFRDLAGGLVALHAGLYA